MSIQVNPKLIFTHFSVNQTCIWPGHLVIVQAKYSDLIRSLQNDYVLVVSSTVLHVGQLFENRGHQNSLYWVMEQQEVSMMLIIRTNQAYHSLKDLSQICYTVYADQSGPCRQSKESNSTKHH